MKIASPHHSPTSALLLSPSASAESSDLLLDMPLLTEKSPVKVQVSAPLRLPLPGSTGSDGPQCAAAARANLLLCLRAGFDLPGCAAPARAWQALLQSERHVVCRWTVGAGVFVGLAGGLAHLIPSLMAFARAPLVACPPAPAGQLDPHETQIYTDACWFGSNRFSASICGPDGARDVGRFAHDCQIWLLEYMAAGASGDFVGRQKVISSFWEYAVGGGTVLGLFFGGALGAAVGHSMALRWTYARATRAARPDARAARAVALAADLIRAVKCDDVAAAKALLAQQAPTYLPVAPAGATAFGSRFDTTCAELRAAIEVAHAEHRKSLEAALEAALDDPEGITPAHKALYALLAATAAD